MKVIPKQCVNVLTTLAYSLAIHFEHNDPSPNELFNMNLEEQLRVNPIFISIDR